MGYDGWNDEYDNADARTRDAYWRRWNRWKWRPRDYGYMVLCVVAIIAISVGVRRCGAGPGASRGAGMALPAEARELSGASALSVGSAVLIEWNGSWYEGTVVTPGADAIRVHYAGWSDSWDEDVPRARLRVR